MEIQFREISATDNHFLREMLYQAIFVHHQPGKYKAFSDCCTHGGRELNYMHSDDILQCSSFGRSTFKLSNGQVIKGPAEGPLAIYPLQIADNRLQITFS